MLAAAPADNAPSHQTAPVQPPLSTLPASRRRLSRRFPWAAKPLPNYSVKKRRSSQSGTPPTSRLQTPRQGRRPAGRRAAGRPARRQARVPAGRAPSRGARRAFPSECARRRLGALEMSASALKLRNADALILAIRPSVSRKKHGRKKHGDSKNARIIGDLLADSPKRWAGFGRKIPSAGRRRMRSGRPRSPKSRS